MEEENKLDFENLLKLSKLKINLDEEEKLKDSFGKILNHVSAITSYEVEQNLQMTHVHEDERHELREDIEGEKLDIELGLKNAPQRNGRYFKTPLIIETKKDK